MVFYHSYSCAAILYEVLAWVRTDSEVVDSHSRQPLEAGQSPTMGRGNSIALVEVGRTFSHVGVTT